MKSQPTTFKSGALSRFLRVISIAGLLSAFLLLLSIQSSHAGSATWLASPASGDWNTAGNWTAGGPPNGSADTATFDVSNTTGVSLSLNTEVNGIVFNAGANAFTITASPSVILTISGAGITNNSGMTQNFVAPVDQTSDFGTIAFTNSATAGSLTAFTVDGGDGEAAPGSIIQFFGTSTADNGTFTVNGGTNGTYIGNSEGGLVEFLDSSTAGSGTFTLYGTENFNGGGGVSFYSTSTAGDGIFTVVGGTTDYYSTGAGMGFYDSSTAGNGTFTITVANAPYGGSLIVFNDNSNPDAGTFIVNGSDGTNGSSVLGNAIYFLSNLGAGNATVIANGGINSGTGGTINLEFSSNAARIEVFGNGLGDYTSGSLNIDVDSSDPPPVTIGSIEGSGVVFLGGRNLIVGNNNLSTTFSGIMQDGPLFGVGGSLTKIGKGKLSLSKASIYTGGTTVSKGALLVTNKTGSATGTGPVLVQAGTLGGTGKISGAVTIASGRTPAILAPGSGTKPGTLTTLSTLAFNARATYKIDLNSTTVKADKVAALGVTITSGALVSIDDLGHSALSAGTVFSVINNTAATPIAGTFSNLADGSTLTVGSNTYRANYEGGTGNDLTLTVQ